jgi:predicted  nucleic acid-binding Zn-ribbon protein
MNIGFQLYQLQEIDSNIYAAKKRVLEIDTFFEKDSSVKQAQEQLENAKKKFFADSNEFNRISGEISSKKEKISISESSLYNGSIKNPKELQDLQREIGSLKKAIEKLEDVLLDVMIQVENSEKDVELKTEELKTINSTYSTQSALLIGEKNNLLEKIDALTAKRAIIIDHVDQEHIDRYSTLFRNKNGLAITNLIDGSCGACGTNLTASQQQEARSAATLFMCPSCGRIIYGSA